jgi:hypothetical protein
VIEGNGNWKAVIAMNDAAACLNLSLKDGKKVASTVQIVRMTIINEKINENCIVLQLDFVVYEEAINMDFLTSNSYFEMIPVAQAATDK